MALNTVQVHCLAFVKDFQLFLILQLPHLQQFLYKTATANVVYKGIINLKFQLTAQV
jgi:hypothetical protein